MKQETLFQKSFWSSTYDLKIIVGTFLEIFPQGRLIKEGMGWNRRVLSLLYLLCHTEDPLNGFRMNGSGRKGFMTVEEHIEAHRFVLRGKDMKTSQGHGLMREILWQFLDHTEQGPWFGSWSNKGIHQPSIMSAGFEIQIQVHIGILNGGNGLDMIGSETVGDLLKVRRWHLPKKPRDDGFNGPCLRLLQFINHGVLSDTLYVDVVRRLPGGRHG